MSQAETDLGELLEDEFNAPAFPQWPIKIGKKTLFLDYYIPRLKIAFETDGRQHTEFVRFYHRTVEGFGNAKLNDKLKTQWCLDNNVTLIRINYTERVSIDTIRAKVKAALNNR